MAAIFQFSEFYRTAYRGFDCVELGESAVLVVEALDQQHRSRHQDAHRPPVTHTAG